MIRECSRFETASAEPPLSDPLPESEPSADSATLEQQLQAAQRRIQELEAQLRSEPGGSPVDSALAATSGDSSLFFQRLGQHTVCGVYVYDLVAGRNIYINRRYTELLGYTLDQINAFDPDAFMALFHPSDLQRVLAHMVIVGERTDNAPVPIEYRFRHREGAWVWCRSSDLAFHRGPDGRMLQFMGSFVDITDVMEAKMSQSQLARLAAHDLRAPARRIRQYVELLREELGTELGADAAVLLDSVDGQAQRMQLLVDGFRRLTTLQAPDHREQTSLHELVDSVLSAIPPELADRSIEVVKDPLPTLPAYPELVRTLYSHLVNNALRHGSDALQLHFTAELKGGAVVLGVRNSGSPFPAHILESVFVPFRPGRRRSLEAGLGLPICKRVVDLHRGRIWIEAEEGHNHIRFTLHAAAK